jgi:hypothetical protein
MTLIFFIREKTLSSVTIIALLQMAVAAIMASEMQTSGFARENPSDNGSPIKNRIRASSSS